MKWRDIETAPKGQTVLVSTTDLKGNFGTRVVMACLRKTGWNHTGAKWTHWMPLPEPPK